jgi:hypothetical protein
MSLATDLAMPVEQVEIGCYVWALDLNQIDADASQVKGGVVVAIETAPKSDGTGEAQRRFITATQFRGDVVFEALLAENVRQVALPNSAAMWGLIRAAAAAVAKSKKRGSSTARCIALQHQLLEVLG